MKPQPDLFGQQPKASGWLPAKYCINWPGEPKRWVRWEAGVPNQPNQQVLAASARFANACNGCLGSGCHPRCATPHSL